MTEDWCLSARDRALELFRKGLAAADPYPAVLTALRDRDITKSNLRYVALGKAAVPMMRAAMDWMTPKSAILVTNPENAKTLAGVRCLIGDHPTPSPRGAKAAKEVEALLADAGVNDRILLFLSGGASALLPAPIDRVSLDQKIALNDQMLAAGLPIEQVNCVRRALSRLKGGGFLRQAAPAKVTCFVLSDVVSDDLKFIASGPTISRSADENPREILENVDLWATQPGAIKSALLRDTEAVPTQAEHILVGSNRKSVLAMAADAAAKMVLSQALVGDVEQLAQHFASLAKKNSALTVLSGGEPTVLLKGDGVGGRNQELALRVALALDGLEKDWVFLSAGTDGRDGPTDAAGAMVDKGSLARAHASGVDPIREIANNNSYKVLDASSDLLKTGGIGTNVADLHVLILGS